MQHLVLSLSVSGHPVHEFSLNLRTGRLLTVHTHYHLVLDNDQLDTQLIYFTIRLL